MTYYDETHLLGVAATQAHGDEITAVTLPEMEVVACFADAKAPRERLGKGQRRHGCILWVQDELDGPATTPIIAEEKQKQSIITRKQLDQVPDPGCCPLLGGITVSADARNFGRNQPGPACSLAYCESVTWRSLQDLLLLAQSDLPNLEQPELNFPEQNVCVCRYK